MELEGMNLINLTPHELVVYLEDDVAAVAWKSKGLARVKETTEKGPWLRVWLESPEGTKRSDLSSATFASCIKSYGTIEGLPAAQEGTIYVVSLVVLQALAGSRPDCYAPDSGPDSAIRDREGKIVGVSRLMQLA